MNTGSSCRNKSVNACTQQSERQTGFCPAGEIVGFNDYNEEEKRYGHGKDHSFDSRQETSFINMFWKKFYGTGHPF